MSKQHKIFIPIHKIDEERRLVYGIATEEIPDKQGEICDYKTSKPFYEKWSSDIEKATDGKSKGNLRVMHGNKVAGTIPQINFNDEAKQIEICAKVIDDDEWKMVVAGGYTGFSQGGSYEAKWKDGEFMRYTSNPCEISLVDNPCLSTATFEVLKSDGSVELRKFKTLENNIMANNLEKSEVTQGWAALDGSFHLNKAAAIAHNEDLAKAKEKKDETKEDDKSKDDESTKKDDKKKESDDDNKKAEEVGDDEKDGKSKKKSKKNSKEKDDATKTETVASEGLKKYAGTEIYDVRCALDALITVMSLFDSESFQAKFLGENEPGQLADLKIVIEKLKTFIASEIMESDEVKDPEVLAMADKGDLQKVGAKISAETKSHIFKMYKSAKDHMGTMDECMKSMGTSDDSDEDKEDAEKSVKAELEKVQAEKDELQKKLEDNTTETLQKLNSTIDTLVKRISVLESQPADAKGVRTIFKDNENHGGEAGNSSPVEDLMKRTGLSPEAFAQEYIKIQLKK